MRIRKKGTDGINGYDRVRRPSRVADRCVALVDFFLLGSRYRSIKQENIHIMF